MHNVRQIPTKRADDIYEFANTNPILDGHREEMKNRVVHMNIEDTLKGRQYGTNAPFDWTCHTFAIRNKKCSKRECFFPGNFRSVIIFS